MNKAAAFRSELFKELRALLPLFVACSAALGAAIVWREGILLQAAIAAYIAGPLAIGAHSIGHEYAHGTLGTLLSHPADRRHLYLLKFGVVASMVLTLAVIAANVLWSDDLMDGIWRHASVQILPILGGLFVAPWLTMICRHALAGMLLTGSVASVTLLVTMVMVAWWSGIEMESAQAAVVAPWARAMIALSALAGILGLRRFTQLEAIEDGGASFELPRWLARANRRRGYRPVGALAAKELQLQHLTLALAALFAGGSLVLSLLQRTVPFWSAFPAGAVTLLYCMSLPVLIGALASAEERQHGTLEWQLLQPVPLWQQWGVKIGVSLGLALVLGVALPVLLVQVAPVPDRRIAEMWRDLAVVVVLLTAGSLYISSLADSGVRAMTLLVPAGVGVALLMRGFNATLGLVTAAVVDPDTADLVSGAVLPTAIDPAFKARLLAVVLALAVLPLLLWLAFDNHRRHTRCAGGIVWQFALIAVTLMGAMSAAAAATTFVAR